MTKAIKKVSGLNKKDSCKDGLVSGLISKDIYEKEVKLCKQLSLENVRNVEFFHFYLSFIKAGCLRIKRK